jgi:para-nitrobenzyl esterase
MSGAFLPKTLVQALVGLAALAWASTAVAQTAVEATLPVGRVRGEIVDGVASFKGLPFASPPVGDLRWRAPQPAQPWTEVRDATAFGAPCMQLAAPEAFAKPPSEDCLTLNVWRPARADKPLPVMVWIHGGGSNFGSGSDKAFDGAALARHGVVLVTINYRLGRLGFFAHPALTSAHEDGDLLGNYGLMDQRAALEWVRDNIGALGGDPSNVTIFGHSAGGCYTNIWMTSPVAQALFAKAITLGCPGFILSEPLTGPASGETRGLAMAEALGVQGEGVDALTRLRGIDAAAFLKRDFMKSAYPYRDGVIVREDPWSVLLDGRQAAKPWIIGSNSFEASYFPFYGVDLSNPLAGYPNDRARILETYARDEPTATEAASGSAFLTDIDMGFSDRLFATQGARGGQPTYLYSFRYLPDALRDHLPGVPHGGELGFVFGRGEVSAGPSLKAPIMGAGRTVSEAMMAYFTRFAATGIPAPSEAWPAYAPGGATLVVGADGHIGPVVDFHKDRLDLAGPFAWRRISRWDP